MPEEIVTPESWGNRRTQNTLGDDILIDVGKQVKDHKKKLKDVAMIDCSLFGTLIAEVYKQFKLDVTRLLRRIDIYLLDAVDGDASNYISIEVFDVTTQQIIQAVDIQSGQEAEWTGNKSLPGAHKFQIRVSITGTPTSNGGNGNVTLTVGI